MHLRVNVSGGKPPTNSHVLNGLGKFAPSIRCGMEIMLLVGVTNVHFMEIRSEETTCFDDGIQGVSAFTCSK